MSNYLGIDYGKKKIGLALAPGGILATGYKRVFNNENLFSTLKKTISDQEIKFIVVGLPLNMNGTVSQSTKNTLDFVNALTREFPDLKVFTYDERLSSKEARRVFPSQKTDDIEAARIILQGYLDKEKQKREKNFPSSL